MTKSNIQTKILDELGLSLDAGRVLRTLPGNNKPFNDIMLELLDRATENEALVRAFVINPRKVLEHAVDAITAEKRKSDMPPPKGSMPETEIQRCPDCDSVMHFNGECLL